MEKKNGQNSIEVSKRLSIIGAISLSLFLCYTRLSASEHRQNLECRRHIAGGPPPNQRLTNHKKS